MRRTLAWLWAAPMTLVGLFLAIVVRLGGGRLDWNGHALEATGGNAGRLLHWMNPWMQINAITLGHVIIARDRALAQRLRSHELVHVRQYERWGPIFPLAYLTSSAIAAWRGECPYLCNAFEKEACQVADFP